MSIFSTFEAEFTITGGEVLGPCSPTIYKNSLEFHDVPFTTIESLKATIIASCKRDTAPEIHNAASQRNAVAGDAES